MPISPDAAALYPDIAAHGSLFALLRAETAGRLADASVMPDDTNPLRATIAATLSWREPLLVIATSYQRDWLIVGSDLFQKLPLIHGRTEDPSAVAQAAIAWHDGASLDAICAAAPFVHRSGRYEVPDRDPDRLTDSAWQSLRRDAADMEVDGKVHQQALIEAAHADPVLRGLYPFTSHWALCFSTTTRPDMTVVGPCVAAGSNGTYSVGDHHSDAPDHFPTAGEAVAEAVRRLPSGLGSVTLGV